MHAALVKGRCVHAPINLIQLTDTHLDAEPGMRYEGLDTLASLRSVVRAVLERPEPPDAVLLTGDLVDRPTPAAYRLLREVLAPLPGPLYCLPGNHDDPGLMARELLDARFRGEPLVELGPWRLLLLDSHQPGSPAGALGESGLARLGTTLGQLDGAPSLIAVHHPPVSLESPWLDSMALAEGPEVLRMAAATPAVRALVFGHVHQVFESRFEGLSILGTPSTGVQFLPRSASFAVDARPPGYRWFRLWPDGQWTSGVEWVPAAGRAGRA